MDLKNVETQNKNNLLMPDDEMSTKEVYQKTLYTQLNSKFIIAE